MALQHVGYTGSFSMECLAWPEPEVAIERGLATLRSAREFALADERAERLAL